MTKHFIFFLLLIIAVSTVKADVLVLSYSISKDDSVKIYDVDIANLTSLLPETNNIEYRLEFLDENNNKLEEINIPVVFYVPDLGFVNESVGYIRINHNPKWRYVKFVHNNSYIYTIDLDNYVKIEKCGNGVCDFKENYGVCSEDCLSGGKDNFCDMLKDGKCDPDCRKEDPDCEKRKAVCGNMKCEAGEKFSCPKDCEKKEKILEKKNNKMIYLVIYITLIASILALMYAKMRKKMRKKGEITTLAMFVVFIVILITIIGLFAIKSRSDVLKEKKEIDYYNTVNDLSLKLAECLAVGKTKLQGLLDVKKLNMLEGRKDSGCAESEAMNNIFVEDLQSFQTWDIGMDNFPAEKEIAIMIPVAIYYNAQDIRAGKMIITAYFGDIPRFYRKIQILCRTHEEEAIEMLFNKNTRYNKRFYVGNYSFIPYFGCEVEPFTIPKGRHLLHMYYDKKIKVRV